MTYCDKITVITAGERRCCKAGWMAKKSRVSISCQALIDSFKCITLTDTDNGSAGREPLGMTH